MKKLLKQFCRGLALVGALPLACSYRMGRFLLGAERVFPGWSQAFSLLPGLTGAYLRRAFYTLVLPECAGGSHISFGTIFSHSSARIGQDVYVGAYCVLGAVTLEADVLIGSHVSVMNGSRQHGINRLDIPVREQPGCWPRVTIGRDTWIGDRAVIMADVGRHAVVAAGAVVTRPVPDYAIVAGVPAKVIGNRRETASHEGLCRDLSPSMAS
ncbi:MAG TPA: DapH/DapD/GlmU-related protein [Pirellulales bacterium]|nr:DapH/DapD/GlmU-related protein [Pirellulales bacterium]